MDEDSDELEDRDEVMEPRVQSSLSSENEDDAEETEVAFRTTRAGDSSNFLGNDPRHSLKNYWSRE